MAMQQGTLVLGTDLQSMYSDFNTFIQNFGGPITQLSTPAAHKKVEASDINALNNKITEFQQDEYLSTQSSWWVSSTVTVGSLITPVTNIITTISNFDDVICRNQATNNNSQNARHCDANGNHGQCCNTNSTNGNCCNTNGNHGNCCNTNGNHGNCCNTNGNHGNCCNHNGNNGNYCSNRSFKYRIDKVVRGSGSTPRPGKFYTDNYAAGSATWTPAGGTTPCTNSCNESCNRDFNRNYGYTSLHTCNVTCSLNTHGQGCGNGNHGQGCGNGNHGQGCGNGNHGQGCGNGNHGQGCNRGNNGNSCSQGNHGQTCSNTTTIDITCNQATKANS